MNLIEAFDVSTQEVVALVGGGGKTTTMFRLGRELADRGARVIVTTTTHIFPPGPGQSDVNIYADELESLLTAIKARFNEPGVMGVGLGISKDEKVQGIPPEWLAELAHVADCVIVEADGSKGRAFKAPAAHEPVIPSASTLVVALVGIDAVGLALTDENVHRPERVSAITGAAMRSPITCELVAEVIAHSEGLAKGMPENARLVAFLNRIQDESHLAQARDIARQLSRDSQGDCSSSRRLIERVVIGRAQEPDPAIEVHINEAAVR